MRADSIVCVSPASIPEKLSESLHILRKTSAEELLKLLGWRKRFEVPATFFLRT